MAVARCVKEERAHVLRSRVRRKDLLVGRGEGPVRPLRVERARLALGPAHVHVVEAVAGDIGHGQARALRRKLTGQQRLAPKVGVVVFLVGMAERDLPGDVFEEGRCAGRLRHGEGAIGRVRRRGLRLPHSEPLVRGHVRAALHAPIGPGNRHCVHRVGGAHPNREPRPAGRLEAAHRVLLPVVGRSLVLDGHRRPEPAGVGRLAVQRELEESVVGLGGGLVPENEGLVPKVVDHEIGGAVVVEVPVRGPVGEAGSVEPPLRRGVFEAEAVLVAEGVVRKPLRRHLLDEVEKFGPAALLHPLGGRSGGQFRHEVLVGHVLVDAVRDEDIRLAVEVEVRHERPPAPVRRVDPGELGDFAERTSAAIELQRVVLELVVIAAPHLRLVRRPALEGRGRLEPIVAPGAHVGHEEVGPAVVGQVADVGAHGGEAGGRHLLRQDFAERPVLVVEVEVVPFEEVVGDVQVGPAVAVQVPHADAQAEGDLALVDAGLLGDVRERAPVVAEELVAAQRVALAAPVLPEVELADRRERVVQEVEVEVPILVIVEEGGVGGVSRVVEPILGGSLLKLGDSVLVGALVDEQLVPAVVVGEFARVADVDVEPFVPVHVGHGHAGGPGARAGHPGRRRHVLEPPVALVQVEPVVVLIGGEVEVLVPVAVEVPNGHPAAVVVIAVGEDIGVFGVGQFVGKVDVGVGRGQFREERFARLSRRTVGSRRGRRIGVASSHEPSDRCNRDNETMGERYGH